MRLTSVNNLQMVINLIFAILLVAVIFFLIRIIQSKKVKLLPSFLNKKSRFMLFLIKRKTLLLVIFSVLVILVLGTCGTVLALSLKTKSEGDIDYKNTNYEQSLAKYNKARDLWFPGKIDFRLRDRDLETKITKANVMVKSGNNYKLGVDAYTGKRYSEAKNYLSQLVETDPHFQEAQQIFKDIQEKTKKIPTPEPEQQVIIETENNPNLDEKILINYKLDVIQVKDAATTLSNTVINNLESACPAIISSRESRNNYYYIYQDLYNNLLSKYGKYRQDFNYIDNNLNSWYGVFDMLKNECKNVGYDIN